MIYKYLYRHRFTNRVLPVSNGSGFIVRSDGLVLTNAHVVGNSTTVSCRLQDGRTFEASVMAVDPISDLATVKISAVRILITKDIGNMRKNTGDYTATFLELCIKVFVEIQMTKMEV